VAYKKRQRAKKRKEMELLMRDNLLNILTVPGIGASAFSRTAKSKVSMACNTYLFGCSAVS